MKRRNTFQSFRHFFMATRKWEYTDLQKMKQDCLKYQTRKAIKQNP